MPQFFSTVYLPEDFDPSSMDESTILAIDTLNKELIAAGVRKFAGGLYPASYTKSLRPQPDGGVLITDGPYLEAKEHVGGISIVECGDMDEAVGWAHKGAVACRMPGEVREIFTKPAAK